MLRMKIPVSNNSVKENSRKRACSRNWGKASDYIFAMNLRRSDARSDVHRKKFFASERTNLPAAIGTWTTWRKRLGFHARRSQHFVMQLYCAIDSFLLTRYISATLTCC